MAVGGGNPGKTVKFKVVDVVGDEVYIRPDVEDLPYFEVGSEYVAVVTLARKCDPGGENEQGNG